MWTGAVVCEPSRSGRLVLLPGPRSMGRDSAESLFLSVPLISHSIHADGLAKPPAWVRTSEGLKAPLMALPEFLGTGRAVGRRFAKGQQAMLETAPTGCVCWQRG